MPIAPIKACIVCEQARPEALGKYSLLGYFGLAPNVVVNIGDFTKPVTLCFVFVGGQATDMFNSAYA